MTSYDASPSGRGNRPRRRALGRGPGAAPPPPPAGVPYDGPGDAAAADPAAGEDSGAGTGPSQDDVRLSGSGVPTAGGVTARSGDSIPVPAQETVPRAADDRVPDGEARIPAGGAGTAADIAGLPADGAAASTRDHGTAADATGAPEDGARPSGENGARGDVRPAGGGALAGGSRSPEGGSEAPARGPGLSPGGDEAAAGDPGPPAGAAGTSATGSTVPAQGVAGAAGGVRASAGGPAVPAVGAPAPDGATAADVVPAPRGAGTGADGAQGSEGGVADPGGAEEAAEGFTVRLDNFEGPFDLLLQLISKHKLDVTEVALSKVTDEFMAHIRAMGADWDLDETTEFLVVAATLLDLKAARLLPAAEVEDEADLALLEARDVLFARLLQYRAYKQIAEIFNQRLEEEARRYPRTVGLEPHHAELLPEVVISIGPEGFARLAVKAMQPKPKPQVYVDHIHAPLVSVQEQAGIVVARLKELREVSFRVLVEDAGDTLTVVARFLALLELYREKAVALEQETALGELLVRWTGGDGEETPTVTDEFDRPPEQPEEEQKK